MRARYGIAAPALVVVASLLAAPAGAQEPVPADTAAPEAAAATDTTAVGDTTAPADTAAADTLAAAEAERGIPSLEGYLKVGVSFRDMVAAAPGDETQVEIWRGPPGQVLRFVTGGTPWAYVVRPPGGADARTLRDFDCSGDFGEELQAGTPLTVPDCAAAGED